MADLQEQRIAAENPTLRIKVRQAVIIAAQKVIDEASTTNNHPNRLLWAKRVLPPPDAEIDRMLAYVIAKNGALTLAQIVGAGDAAVQSAVDGAVDALSP